MNWLRYVSRRSPPAVMAIGMLLVVVLGFVDYLTGPEISFSIFYLIPISVVSWHVGFAAGVASSVLAAVSYLVAVLLGGNEYTHPSIPYWNALVRLGFFVIVAVTLFSLRSAKDRREELRHFIVHDLRSPLANVMTGLEILREDSDRTLDDQQRVFVDICLVSCRRMLTLINSLLDLSRLERGRMPLNRKSIAAAELGESALAQIRLWASHEKVDVHADLPEENVHVHADFDVTLRVLVNLLSNAVQHAPADSTVTLRVEGREQDVQFSVRDEGEGVPEGWAERIFETYVQVESGGRAVSKGSGLGLSFSQRAVQAQGGRIWMESGPGRGTVVSFTLPSASNIPKPTE